MSRRRFELVGWVLFLLSAVAFLAQAVAQGDVLAGIASLLFFAGVVAFLLPFLRPARSRRGDTHPDEDG